MHVANKEQLVYQQQNKTKQIKKHHKNSDLKKTTFTAGRSLRPCE